MMENGKITTITVKEFINGQMVQNIMENGKMITEMVKEFKNI